MVKRTRVKDQVGQSARGERWGNENAGTHLSFRLVFPKMELAATDQNTSYTKNKGRHMSAHKLLWGYEVTLG